MLRILTLILVAVFFILGLIIGFYNAQPVRFSYIVGEFELPLIVLILGEFAVAVLLTLVVVMSRILGLKGEIRRLKRQVKDQETELRNLRNIPMTQPVPVNVVSQTHV